MLLDELSIFYTSFVADNTLPAVCPHVGDEAAMLTLQMADVTWSFTGVNPHKPPGPDGIPGQALGVRTDQLTELFTNISLTQSMFPTPSRHPPSFPVPERLVAFCLNDYHPIALTSVIMKHSERLAKTQISSSLSDTLDSLHFVAYSLAVNTIITSKFVSTVSFLILY